MEAVIQRLQVAYMSGSASEALQSMTEIRKACEQDSSAGAELDKLELPKHLLAVREARRS